MELKGAAPAYNYSSIQRQRTPSVNNWAAGGDRASILPSNIKHVSLIIHKQ